MSGLTAVAEARARVLTGRGPLPPRLLGLADALACVTAEPIVAKEPVPPFTNSAMDGYALRSSDTSGAPVELQVVGELMAGSSLDLTVGTGQAVRIMTGAPLPAGADAVCMVERAIGEPGGSSVTIEHVLASGENVRPAGGDVASGEVVFPAGTVLTPAGLGVLAGLGMLEVLAHPRPRVGVLSTGDELVEGSGPLEPGQIHESNRIALLSLVQQSGFVPVDLGIVGDDEQTVAAALLDGAERCDSVLTSGGVSVGDRDVVKAVLAKLAGETMQWLQIAIKPGKPFAFGEIGPRGTPLFGLPGNPVSAMVSFELFARPVLRMMAGHHQLDRPIVDAVADEALPRLSDGKLHLVRVVAGFGDDGLVHVVSSGGQESHHLHAMARANALALLPDGMGVHAGERVLAMLVDLDGIERSRSTRAVAPWDR
ncbi:MAG: molybdenum cofactor synthesis domain [Acidimicrobiaceae bacterium]|nr:molybdenum cofactor synthesis domain [Acidimicrobiaceae bacterium]